MFSKVILKAEVENAKSLNLVISLSKESLVLDV